MSDFKPLLNPRKALSNYLFNLLPELPEAESSILVASEPVTDMPVNTADSDEIRISLPFQALLFEVNGFSLALPLMVLDGIEKWPDVTLSKMPERICTLFSLAQ